MVGASASAKIPELFSPRVFRCLGNGKIDFLIRLGDQIGYPLEPTQELADYFDEAFKRMEVASARGDFVFRNAVVQKRWLNRHSINTATIVSEHRVGRSRADLVLLNGYATGIEIKSDLDTLSRLQSQIRDYMTVFPQTIVVSGARHVSEIIKAVPASTGVVELTRRNTLKTLVQPIKNYDLIDSDSMAASMSQDEAKKLIAWCGLHLPEVPNTQVWSEIRRVLSGIDRELLCVGYSAVLKGSRSKAQFGEYLESLPKSVQTSLLLGSYSKREWDSISKMMARPTEE